MQNISELIQTNRTKRYEGTTLNKVEILSYLGSKPKSRVAVYECQCSVCNQKFVSSSTNFILNRYLLGCHSCTSTVQATQRRTHNSPTSNKARKSWYKIKERCFNVNCKDYSDYGAKGITMQEDYVNSFAAFYEEVGDPPEISKKWSIDRIDPSKGYVKGNMRWASINQQARNKLKSKANTSGKTGVQWYYQEYNKKHGKGFVLYAVAIWNEFVDGKPKQHNKKFSVTKYGLLPAFAEAVKFRINKIKELNQLGYGYTEYHGQ
jgi:hypothetical protein